jgi:carbon storage regulator
MLVLTRRIGEEIIIAGDIRVTVIAVQGQRVRLGITATPSITIDRAEIALRRQAEAVSAAGLPRGRTAVPGRG